MIEYEAIHFTTEEKYFDQFDYPDKEKHKEEHQHFVGKIREIKEGFDQDRVMISIEVMDFLKNWLVNHIQGSDKQYGPYFNRHGLY
jgi:hemerythrin